MNKPAVVLLLALMAGCAAERGRAPEEPAAGAVRRETGAHGGETVFTVQEGGCRISLEVHEAEVNHHVLQRRADCPLDLAAQAPLLARLLRDVLEAYPEPGRFRTLAWGRIHPDGAGDRTMALRLALAAKRSPVWDATRGAPRGTALNLFAKTIAGQASIYRELQSAFSDIGMELRLASVEKVLVLRAAELPFFEELRQQGVQPGERLPFDFQAWFAFSPPGQ